LTTQVNWVLAERLAASTTGYGDREAAARVVVPPVEFV
jgi:hypothetical protein